MKTISVGEKTIQVLKSWDVNHVYGISGASINGFVEALYKYREQIQYIQVRHEEVGALAASGYAKLTGKVGVCFGSAGPGGTHLFNGLYDGKMENVPILAIIGQDDQKTMNTDYFQEMDETLVYANVAEYVKTATTAQSIPEIVDQAIRIALNKRCVAVVVIPNNLMFEDINNIYQPSACSYEINIPSVADSKLREVATVINQAKHPVLYVGQGARGSAKEIMALADKISAPILLTILAKDVIPTACENLIGSVGRLGTKPGYETVQMADLIIMLGTNFPYTMMWSATAKCIQIDINPERLGKRFPLTVGVNGDVKDCVSRLRGMVTKKEESVFIQASRTNRNNWDKWLDTYFVNKPASPINAESVYKYINAIANEDTIFSVDVGNSKIHGNHILKIREQNRYITSGWFATMGCGITGAIAAKLTYPERQVISISGDGAFAMVMQDMVTQVKYKLNIINIVVSNGVFGYIETSENSQKLDRFAIDIAPIDFVKVAEACGAIGFTVNTYDELEEAFAKAKSCNQPCVINIFVKDIDSIPTERLILYPEKNSREEIDAFKKLYQVVDMPLLSEIISQTKEN